MMRFKLTFPKQVQPYRPKVQVVQNNRGSFAFARKGPFWNRIFLPHKITEYGMPVRRITNKRLEWNRPNKLQWKPSVAESPNYLKVEGLLVKQGDLLAGNIETNAAGSVL